MMVSNTARRARRAAHLQHRRATRKTPPCVAASILLIIGCSSWICLAALADDTAAAVVPVNSTSADGQNSCTFIADIDSNGTDIRISGRAVSSSGAEAANLIYDSPEEPTLDGSLQVELTFAADDTAETPDDCQSLLSDPSRTASALSIRPVLTGNGADEPASFLQLLPSPIELRSPTGILTNVTYANISNVSLSLTTKDSLTLRGQGLFEGVVTTAVTEGFAGATSSLLVPDAEDVSMVNTTMSVVDSPVLAEVNREQLAQVVKVSLRLPSVNVTLPVVTINDQLSAIMTVTGSIRAVARIAPADSGKTPEAATTSNEICRPPGVPDGSSGCACPSGTTGNDCQVCTSNLGCSSDEACSSSFAFSSSSGAKNYACQPQDASLSAVVPSISFSCTPPGGAAAPPASVADLPAMDPEFGFCEVQVAVNLGTMAVVQCTAFNCLMETGNTTTSCGGMECGCPDECPGLESIVASLSGADFDCDSAGSCAVEIHGLPLPNLQADCVAGQCVASSDAVSEKADNSQGAGGRAAPTTTPIPPVNPTAKAEPESSLQVRQGSTETPQAEQSTATASSGCSEGLIGASCGVCSTDSGCAADGATCDTSLVFSPWTSTKSLSCSSDDPTVSEFISSMEMQCTTSGPLPDALQSVPHVDSSASFCGVQVGIKLGEEPVEASCWAYNCSIQANTSKADCTGMTCQCPGDCFGLSTLVGQLSSAAISCSETGECEVSLGGLPISSIAVSCNAGECIDAQSGQRNFTGTGIPGTQNEIDYDRVSIAVVGFLPLAILLLLLAVIILLARGCAWICLASTGKKISPGRQWPIGALSFTGLSVAVPQRKGNRDTAQQPQPVAEAAEEGQLSTRAAPLSGMPSVEVNWTASKRSQPSSCHPSKRYILSDVSCSVAQGEVLAIMGPSGSGKTTLLSILAAREGDLGSRAKVKGEVLVDGARRKQRQFRAACAYVPQDDTLFPSLTVRETVGYSARLRMPELDAAHRKALITETIEELRLFHVADTRLGSPGAGGSGRGVSGGERRRVTIAMEMVTQPSILMLDEPTSGLDSYAAGSLMSSLKDIAAPGRVVVLTLHQPSPSAFMQLDKVLLLASGQRVFHGSPTEVETFFESSGFPCSHGIPIADHMLTVVSDHSSLDRLMHAGQVPPADSASPAQCVEQITASQKTHESKQLSADEESLRSSGLSSEGWLLKIHSALVQLDVLLWRGGTIMARNPALLLMHSLIAILMGVGMGLVFLGVDDSLAGLQNKAGGIFFTLAFFAFCSLTTVDSFLNERSIVLREVQSGYYRAFGYLLIKVVLDTLLLRVLPAVLFSLPFYYLMGLSTEWERILVWFAILTTFSSTAGALSMAASVGCPTAGTANLVMTLLLLVSLVFGGFLANLEVMPTWISWISYLSIFRYAFEALVVNEVTGSAFNLDVGGYTIDGLDNQLLLDVLGLNEDNFLLDAVILDVLFAGFLLVSAAVLFAILPRHSRRRSCRALMRGCTGNSSTAT